MYYWTFNISYHCISLIENKQQRFCASLLVIVDYYDNRCKTFVLHSCPWFELKWVEYVSKLWSRCLYFRACLWAFLSAFSWRFCLVGLSVYSYPGLEAHVCNGLSGSKQYVTCVRLLLLVTWIPLKKWINYSLIWSYLLIQGFGSE